MFACIHWPRGEPRVLAESFSPWVEQVAPDTVLFSIEGLGRIFGDAAAIVRAISDRAPEAHVAMAATPDAAVLAARSVKGIGIIPAGEEVQYLGSLPLDRLPLDPEIWSTLDRWGLRTLGDLACLPESGLHERLGEAGVRLQRMARGALGRPLQPVIPETVYAESIELDHPLELLEPLLFLLNRFLVGLCARLKAQSLAAGELHLTINRAERVLRLPFPTRDTKFLLRLLQHNLETGLPGEPVSKIALRILPAEPRLVQHDLFTIPSPEPERLELTLGKIRGMVGEKNVVVPVIRNTHRPGWGPSESHIAFRHFRPPLVVRVELQDGLPHRLRVSGISGTVTQLSGPWRTSGDWWRADAWDRDEFDLALSTERDVTVQSGDLGLPLPPRRQRQPGLLTDGALYRVCFDRRTGQWLMEGVYD
jgi:protein ImuB